MRDDNVRAYRRSKRLSISVSIVVSGVDADGNSFSEIVRTLVINQHGGKIAMTNRLTMGTEVSLENRALGVVVRAHVVWWGEKGEAGDLHLVGLRLVETHNVWGITFPPDDWGPESVEEAPSAPTG
jgi:hypothetical protein